MIIYINMVFLTPQSFLFFMLYILFLFFMLCVDSFYVFWAFLEISTLIFMGMSYSLFKNNFSQLLTFFIIQTISAFSVLVFYIVGWNLAFTLSVLLKLSIFPFHFWYLNIVTFFPNVVLFISRTFFKIPSLFLVYIFYPFLSISFLFVSIIITIFIGSLSMVFSNDLRFLLVSSSVANNSWFILSILASALVFSFYLLFYSIFLFLILNSLEGLSSSFVLKTSPSFHLVLISLVAIAGIPPFPVFFIKILSVLRVSFYILESSIFIFFIMLFRVFMLLGYLKYSFSLIFDVYITQQHIFL